MNDLISRQDAIDAVSKYKKEHGYAYYDCACEIEKDIKQLPSAQTEIIYCRDCIHAIKDGLCGGYWCKGKAVKSSHFCGYAERRTDE